MKTPRIRTALATAALGVAALALAPSAMATANTFETPQLLPVTSGGLWKGGTIYQRTMTAQAGTPATVRVSSVHTAQGSIVVGSPVLTTYLCEGESKQVSPARRAAQTAFKPATCVQLGEKRLSGAADIPATVPATSVGSYLSAQMTVTFSNKGTLTAVSKWVEDPIYPANPVSAGAPYADGPIYAGASATYLTRSWSVPQYANKVGDASQAWVCPNANPNKNAAALSDQGCYRVHNVARSTPGDETFGLSGRIRKQHAEGMYLYEVSFTTIDPNGPLGNITWEIRSQGRKIRPIPAPKATVTASGLTLSTSFTGVPGVKYEFVASHIGGKRQIATWCTSSGTTVSCSLDASQAGDWRVTIVPVGLKATGTNKRQVVTVTAPAPAA